MYRGNFFRRTLLTLFTVSIMLFAAVVGAKIQMYTANGEGYCYESESQDIAKKRAVDKAIKKATKEAGVYLKSISRTVDGELTDDDITAITSNAWQLVGEPKFTREIINHSDDTQIIVWKATIEVNIDDSEIQSWIKRDSTEKFNIINQTREAQKLSEENDKKIEDLREKYNRATSQAEKNKILKQMNDNDRDFLANQKNEEGNKLYYAQNYGGAIKSYDEAIKIKPDWSWYYNRGNSYYKLGKNELAIQDFNKSIQLNPNYDKAYNNRGNIYDDLGQYELAIKDFDKSIQLNPNYDLAYNNRGVVYNNLKQYERAIQDFDKSIKINPNYDKSYNNRGNSYNYLGKYERAIQDFDKAIKLNPNYDKAYNNRGVAYINLEKYERAIQDFDKAIKLNPNYATAYNNRGAAYGGLGQHEKALKNFEKALEINPNDEQAKNNIEICRKLIGK